MSFHKRRRSSRAATMAALSKSRTPSVHSTSATNTLATIMILVATKRSCAVGTSSRLHLALRVDARNADTALDLSPISMQCTPCLKTRTACSKSRIRVCDNRKEAISRHRRSCRPPSCLAILLLSGNSQNKGTAWAARTAAVLSICSSGALGETSASYAPHRCGTLPLTATCCLGSRDKNRVCLVRGLRPMTDNSGFGRNVPLRLRLDPPRLRRASRGAT
mmetsp:Transcript_91128/g.243956  ORF Transcript_91128/g.243956 Transcript_91128/m.243956 type:complete len:220 (-) Transcript_91128:44-703(-)